MGGRKAGFHCTIDEYYMSYLNCGYFCSALCSIQNISFLEDIVKAYKQPSAGAENEVNVT